MKNKSISIETSYLDEVYQPANFELKIKAAVREIKEFQKKINFDSLAFTGHSGAAFAYPLSYILGMPLMCVRKDPNNSHYFGKFEGFANSKKYLIVDDGYCSGQTVKNIITEINEFYKGGNRRRLLIKPTTKRKPPKCVGMLFYRFEKMIMDFEKYKNIAGIVKP